MRFHSETSAASGYSSDEHTPANDVMPSLNYSRVREDLAAQTNRARSSNTLGIDVRSATSRVRFSDVHDIRVFLCD